MCLVLKNIEKFHDPDYKQLIFTSSKSEFLEEQEAEFWVFFSEKSVALSPSKQETLFSSSVFLFSPILLHYFRHSLSS